ncbi:hypothetical protein BdWA1_000116 [Babesia duncani]|uniref:Uncharacterized protein n=1 Tax=Babesia duncani TaxID=323732 RepID=A0AAD9PMG9_9APIC|nr:hypothetical protein BdWA1_000116 [Babesia duncani]
MSDQHEDVYFNYMISGTNYTFRGFQIVKFNFNSEEYKFECNKEFMYKFRLENVTVYACKIGSDLKPWLLQLYGYYYDSSSPGSSDSPEPVSSGDVDPSSSLAGLTSFNYFFKRDGKNWKSLTFANFTDKQYQKIGQDQGGEDDEYISNLKKSGFSAASGYVSSGSTSSIQPNKLPDYLSESDKKHTYVSGSVSEEYSVSKFSSGTGSHKFEITLKGMFSGVDESSRSSGLSKSSNLKTVTYHTETESTATRTEIKLKSQPSADIVSGTETSCKATVTEQATESSPVGGTGGLKSPQPPQISSGPTGSKVSPIASKFSSNTTPIVCGALFGSGGLIGGGILIYKCIG